jgi:chromate reductase
LPRTTSGQVPPPAQPGAARQGKDWAITGTSQGVISTALAQAHLRLILGVLGCTVIGGEVYLQFKPDLIDDAGHITVESTRNFCRPNMDRFATLVERLVIPG